MRRLTFVVLLIAAFVSTLAATGLKATRVSVLTGHVCRRATSERD
jgi:hypothetical protein